MTKAASLGWAHGGLAWSLAFLLFGCGYQFRVEGAGPVVGGSPHTTSSDKPKGPPPKLAIAPFDNHTFEPNIEQKFTAYTRHEFSAGGGVEVVNEKAAADLFMKTQIVAVLTPSLSFNQSVTFEQRVMVTVKATVQDLPLPVFPKTAVWPPKKSSIRTLTS